jgi:hypothetical protein
VTNVPGLNLLDRDAISKACISIDAIMGVDKKTDQMKDLGQNPMKSIQTQSQVKADHRHPIPLLEHFLQKISGGMVSVK